MELVKTHSIGKAFELVRKGNYKDLIPGSFLKEAITMDLSISDEKVNTINLFP